jgi:hypothetical protein
MLAKPYHLGFGVAIVWAPTLQPGSSPAGDKLQIV